MKAKTYTVLEKFETESGRTLRARDKFSVVPGRGYGWVSQRGTGLPERVALTDAEIATAKANGLIR